MSTSIAARQPLADRPAHEADRPAHDAGRRSSAAAGTTRESIRGPGAVAFSGVAKTYQSSAGPVQALDAISLEIAPGSIFGIIGRSGAGKSSLLRTINRLEQPSSGQVRVDGVDIGTLDESQLVQLRRRIGMIFQHFNLLSAKTVHDNVALPLQVAGLPRARIDARVKELLALVGLQEKAGTYPSRLSGGQKQRVGIARALVHEPEILLCDEATSALDPETTRSILDLLRKVNRELGLTVVLITHQMQVIKQIADRVAVIDGGEIAELGPVIDVFTRPQQAITRSLIDEIVPQQLPESVAVRVNALAAQLAPGQQGRLLRLSYAGESAYQPILSHLIRELGLDLSILHGQIDEIQEQTFGSLAVFASGDAAKIDAAVDHLRATGVQVQIVSTRD